MRMLMQMCGKTRNDRIRNANIHDMVGVAPIEDKLRDNRLKQFGCICRTPTPTDALGRISDMIIGSDNTREWGRLKLTLDAVVKK